MNQSYPSTEMWRMLYKQNSHLLTQYHNQNYQTIMQNLNYENVIIITYQLQEISRILEQFDYLDLHQQILQEVPHLIFLLDHNKSTVLSLVILNIFKILLKKVNSEFKIILVQNQGIPVLINRLNILNIEILNSICYILSFLPEKLLIQSYILGPIMQMVENLKYHKIESEYCFNLIPSIVLSWNFQENKEEELFFEEIFQYVLQLRNINCYRQLLCLCIIIEKTKSYEKLLLFTLQQQNFFQYMYQNREKNFVLCLKFLNLLLNKQKLNNQVVFDFCIKILNETTDKHQYKVTSEYSNLIANLSIENPQFIQSVVKSQKILDNLFSFYDQISIKNLISFSNQVAKHNLDYELKYLMNKGLIYKYIHLLQKNILQFQTLALKGIKELLTKGYIRDDIKLINKAVLQIYSSQIDKQLLSDIKYLIKQQRDQYM